MRCPKNMIGILVPIGNGVIPGKACLTIVRSLTCRKGSTRSVESEGVLKAGWRRLGCFCKGP